MYYVYLLKSDRDSGFYIGYSADLRKRVQEHKRGLSFSTSTRGPWQLIYYEAYLNQKDALGREKFLKSGSGRRLLSKQLGHYLQKHPIGEAGPNKNYWLALPSVPKGLQLVPACH
jgi:putative endonuclease